MAARLPPPKPGSPAGTSAARPAPAAGPLAALREEHRRERGTAHERMAPAFDEDGIDVAAYESALRTMADRRVTRRVEIARLAQRALEVLDADQRGKFLYGVHLMRRMHRMHMRGGRMGAPEGGGEKMKRKHRHERRGGQGDSHQEDGPAGGRTPDAEARPRRRSPRSVRGPAGGRLDHGVLGLVLASACVATGRNLWMVIR